MIATIYAVFQRTSRPKQNKLNLGNFKSLRLSVAVLLAIWYNNEQVDSRAYSLAIVLKLIARYIVQSR